MPTTSGRLDMDVQRGKPAMLLTETTADAARWAAEHRGALRAAVTMHGCLLVRGLGLRDAGEAEAVFRQLGSVILETEGFAPRQCYAHGVYSSSMWPPNEPMCMHHELSYRLQFPSLMLFACLHPPVGAGATTVADSPTVLQALPTEVVERFGRVGWLLIRNYGNGIGVSLADAFGTENRGAIERYCRANAITFEWQLDGVLRTWQRRSPILHHPLTGQACWFNQIAFLNDAMMDPAVREYLTDAYGEDGLPFTTRFGNGEPIEADIVRAISEVYEAHTAREPWQAGDLLLVDNIRTAHAREPFAGRREIVVAMADAVQSSDCSPLLDATTADV